MSRRRAFVVVVSLSAAGSEGCFGNETCNPPGFAPAGVVIGAPAGVVASITGEGICNSTARCIPRNFSDPEPFAPGCTEYQLLPHDTGRCVIVVRLTNGEEQRFETNIVEETSCSSALVAEDGGVTTFEVQAPDGGTSSDGSTDG